MEKKLIDGYPSYAVYESGEICSVKTGKRLEPQIKNGYAVFYPSVPNRPDGSRDKKMLSIHLVVAEAFLPKEEGAKYVVHIDGDKFNNRVGNLVRRANARNQKNSVQVAVSPPVVILELPLVEEWAQISGVSGYEISNTGSVRNSNTKKPISQRMGTSGYLVASCHRRYIKVHLAVANNFLMPRTARFLKHKDDNRFNNAVSNLEWSNCLRLSNGDTRSYALTPEGVADIKRRLAAGESGAALARIFGVSQGNISNINRGYIWNHIESN